MTRCSFQITFFRYSPKFMKRYKCFSLTTVEHFSGQKMSTKTNKRKLATVSKETKEGHPRNSQSRKTSVHGITEDYITQVSEDIEGRITKQLSQEFSRSKSWTFGALSKLDEFPLNPHIRTTSGTVPGTFRTTDIENLEPTGDHSQKDSHAEVESSVCQSPNLIDSDPDQASHMVTRFQERIHCCSPGTSSGKLKKARSTSQPELKTLKTPLRQSKQTKFRWPFDSWRVLSTPLTSTKSTELQNWPNPSQQQWKPSSRSQRKLIFFEDLSQTRLKILTQLTEEEKNYFHSPTRGDALQAFKNISSPNRENLAEMLTVFRRKNVKPQSKAMAKQKFQRPLFSRAKQKLIGFLDELHKLAKDAFPVDAQAIIKQCIYAKNPSHLKKTINQAQLENGTYK